MIAISESWATIFRLEHPIYDYNTAHIAETETHTLHRNKYVEFLIIVAKQLVR